MMTPVEQAIHSLHRKGRISDEGLVKIASIKKESSLTPADLKAIAKVVNKAKLKRIGLAALGAGAAIFGAKGGEALYNKVKTRSTYGKMMNEFPELKEYDQGLVKKKFDALSQFAPKLSHNPLVAGSFVLDMMQMGKGIDVGRIKNLVDTEKSIEDRGFIDTITKPAIPAALKLGVTSFGS